jgi:hypothetical protein
VFALAVAFALPTANAAPARAGTEEWTTFDPTAQEEDDESVLDHFLTRTPTSWRDDWERAPLAIRTAQGCLTSGQWFIDTDLKLRAPLGKKADFGLLLRQSETDVSKYQYTDFQFRFPVRYGTATTWFRPLYDKSRQDLGIGWGMGTDTSRSQLQLTFAFEDMFNNLWAFRQTRVGNASESEPYEKHPYEPAVMWISRNRNLRFEIEGRYLTPSRKRLIDFSRPVPQRITTLWGTIGRASVEVKALGAEWEVRTHNQQAFSTDLPVDLSEADAAFFRRAWSVESAVRRGIARRWSAEARWQYYARDARRGPPVGPASFASIDRMVALEARWAFAEHWGARFGTAYDRVTVSEAPYYPMATYGTRTESRGFFGLEARFGNVRLAAVEGIELDPEPYDVWWVHDKGFLQLQAIF